MVLLASFMKVGLTWLGLSGFHILWSIIHTGKLISSWHQGQYLALLWLLLLNVVLVVHVRHPVSVLWGCLGTDHKASRGQLGQRTRLLLMWFRLSRDHVVVR
jgi:hypothetical protein